METKIIKFDNTHGTDIEAWNKAVAVFREWQGMGEIVIRKPTRTPRQNRTIHAIFSEIANTMAEYGLNNNLTIKARPTKDNIKTFFREKFLDGKSTAEVTTSELANALTLLLESFNEFFKSKGIKTVHVDSEELKSLLNSEK